MKHYSNYKDLGVEWLGKIPEHWQPSSIRGVTKAVTRRNCPNLPLLAVYRDYGVILRDSRDDNHNRIPEDLSNYKVVKPGNLVLNKMKTWQGSLGVSEYEGIVSPAYIICELSQDINPKFLHYLLRSYRYIFIYNKISYGVRVDQWDMHYEDFKQIPIFLASVEEQKTIARFLDRKLEQIGHFISNKQRLIELLKEQKTAIVNRAVTKGLNPQASMKPSGIEWLGDIPGHWEVETIGKLSESLQTGPFGSQLHSYEYVTGGIPVINPSNMKDSTIFADVNCAVDQPTWERLKRHALKTGDIIFARRGEMGRCALVTEQENGWICGTGSLRMQPKRQKNNSEFLIMVLSAKGVAEYLSLMSVGSTMENLNTGILQRLPLPIPPVDEQQQIVEYIHKVNLQTNQAIAKTEKEIELIQEYRTTLISDAVTGKIDVRETSAV